MIGEADSITVYVMWSFPHQTNLVYTQIRTGRTTEH